MNHTSAPWNLPLSWFDPANNPNAKADKALADASPEMFNILWFLAEGFAEEFDHDEPINGADFLDWFSALRPSILEALGKATRGPYK